MAYLSSLAAWQPASGREEPDLSATNRRANNGIAVASGDLGGRMILNWGKQQVGTGLG